MACRRFTTLWHHIACAVTILFYCMPDNVFKQVVLTVASPLHCFVSLDFAHPGQQSRALMTRRGRIWPGDTQEVVAAELVCARYHASSCAHAYSMHAMGLRHHPEPHQAACGALHFLLSQWGRSDRLKTGSIRSRSPTCPNSLATL